MPATQEALGEAMRSIFEALRFARGPRGELMFLTDDMCMSLAWHLARAGVPPVDVDRRVIKPRAVPNRPGQFAGVTDWVPWDAPEPDPDDPDAPELVTATGPLPDLDAALPWHVRTKIEGNFT